MIQRGVKSLVETAISNNVLKEEEQAIVEYGLLWAINSVGSLVGFGIIGFLIGLPELVLLGAIVGGIFRFVSGGAHLVRALDCFIFSAFVLVIFSLVAQQGALFLGHLDPLLKAGVLSVILAIGLFMGLRIIDRYAPAGNEKRPITNETERHRLKLLSFTFAFLIFIGFILACFIFRRVDFGLMIMLAFGFQLFSLTPTGFSMVNFVSKKMEKIPKIGR